MCGLFYLRSCAGGTEENGVGKFRIFWDFWGVASGSEKISVFGKFEFFWVSKGMEITTYSFLSVIYIKKCILHYVTFSSL